VPHRLQVPEARQECSAGQFARALGVVLREEFDVPFTFFDAGSGGLVSSPSAETAALALLDVDAEIVHASAADGRARVTRLADGHYRLLLTLCQNGRPILVGAARFAALVAAGPQREVEQARLQKWLQAVSDRLQLADHPARRRAEEYGAQATAAWEVVLTLNQVIRRLRIHKEPERNVRRLLEAAHSLAQAQAVIWVPAGRDNAVLIHGDTTLTQADCRQLATHLERSPGLQPGTPLLINQLQGTSWGGRFPTIANVLAFQLTDPSCAGWIIALNKRGRPESGTAAEFRRSDAAALTPFVGLIELYGRSSGRYQELKDLLVGLTRSLTAALDAKDPYTYGHSERVGRIAVELGRELGLSEDELGDIYLAGLLHDVGKIGVRDTVLSKPGNLTPEEFEHIKQHVTIGYTILSGLRQIRNLLPGVLYHHERFDGKGYPDGLAGEAIPMMARILAVADAYDAMSTNRPYRDAMAYRRVEEIIAEGAGKQWDARIVEAFARCRHKVHAIRQRGVGDSLRLAIDGALRSVTASAESESVSLS
jgi:HD-GYP domain-containing protein (c-di-GMP phosphodiesterase class II)